MNVFAENWLAIIVGIYLISMILWGHYKGFIRLAVSMAALITTLVVVNIAMPQVTKFLKESTTIHQALENSVKKATGVENEPTAELPMVPADEEPENQPENQEEAAELPSVQRIVIENLKLPQQLKDSLIENNNHEVYQMLGVEVFADYIGSYLADVILNVIGFILTFLIVYILLHLLMSWLDIIARLPILSGINKVAGALLGGIEGLLFFWIACLIITAFSSTPWGIAVVDQIESHAWLAFLYNNNFLNVIVMSVVKGMF